MVTEDKKDDDLIDDSSISNLGIKQKQLQRMINVTPPARTEITDPRKEAGIKDKILGWLTGADKKIKAKIEPSLHPEKIAADKTRITAYRKSAPDSSTEVVQAFDRETFDPDFNYFSNIDNKFEKNRIQKLTDDAKRFWENTFTPEQLRNRIAYCWIHLKLDLNDIAKKWQMRKIRFGEEIPREQIADSAIALMTNNGSVVFILGKEGKIHVKYAGNPFRDMFFSGRIKPIIEFESDPKKISSIKIGKSVFFGRGCDVESTSDVLLAYWGENIISAGELSKEAENFKNITRYRASAINKTEE